MQYIKKLFLILFRKQTEYIKKLFLILFRKQTAEIDMKYIKKLFLILFSKQAAEVASTYLDIAKEITSKTKTKLDDQALSYLSTYITWRTKSLDSETKKKVKDLINANITFAKKSDS